MKTITPFELQMLIDKRNVEVIDVRSKQDFDRVHVLVARSVPLKQFEPHSVLAHRRGDKRTPLYIIADRNAQASFVACGLAAAGLAEPIVVDGGVEACEAEWLPVVRRRSFKELRFAIARTLSKWHRSFRSFVRSRADALELAIRTDRVPGC